MTIVIDERPPLGLTVNLQASDGSSRHRWAADDPDPHNRPQSISFKTARFTGWVDGSCILRRPILREWPDTGLLDEITIDGEGGRRAYEGRLISKPRTTDGGHAWTIGAVGWMAHAKDIKVPLLIIDRDITKWNEPSAARKADRIASGFTPASFTALDDGAGASGIETGFDDPGGWQSSTRPTSEAWYDAGDGARIGLVRGTWTRGANVSSADSHWAIAVNLGDTDLPASADTTGDVFAAGPGTVDLVASAARRYAFLQFLYDTSGGSSGSNVHYGIDWSLLRVIGDHGIPINGTTPDTEGFYSSDVIRWLIETYCPKLNADGVMATTLPITQLAPGRIAPYDAFLMCNATHLWGLECWEERTVHYAPTVLDDYDWQVRVSDPGVTVAYQGPAIENLINGIVVNYTDSSTGNATTLLPADHSELRDPDADNPFNRAGYPSWGEIDISTPRSIGEALAAGVAALTEYNRPRSPGTIKVTGHVRDRAGNWQPAYMMRGGERIQVIDDTGMMSPRLLVETDYSGDSRENSLSIDTSSRTLDAALAQIGGD